jgi:hypothetical protein
MMKIDLEASADTPLFGDDIDRAITAYNLAAAAYDQYFGKTTARADVTDLGVHDTLIMFAPGLEIGGDVIYFRIEGTVGVGEDLRSAGIGVYPLNLQARFSRELAVYVSAGGSASWLDRNGSDVGALISARAAGGVRIFERVVVEAGYGAFVLGGVIDIDPFADYVPTPDNPPPALRDAVAAGQAKGVIDVSVGLVF